jgi:formate dehydrogenase iron-sulfur subunit
MEWVFMEHTRRDFLGLVAAATGIGLAAEAVSAQDYGDTDTSLGVLVDTVVCIGCRKCEQACDREHDLAYLPIESYNDKSVFQNQRRPGNDSYTVVNQFSTQDSADRSYTIKVQCMHCLEPACVSACIVGALSKDPKGPVVYDAWKCIGCRYCMVACPFQIPSYEYNDPFTPMVRKCTFCYERITVQGRKPACVSACPNEALTFGKRSELIDVAHARIRQYPEKYVNHVYGEHEIGGTSWMYLSPVPFESVPLPALRNEPVPPMTEKIQHSIFKSFVPPIALYGLLGLIMYTLKRERSHTLSENEPNDRENVV